MTRVEFIAKHRPSEEMERDLDALLAGERRGTAKSFVQPGSTTENNVIDFDFSLMSPTRVIHINNTPVIEVLPAFMQLNDDEKFGVLSYFNKELYIPLLDKKLEAIRSGGRE